MATLTIEIPDILHEQMAHVDLNWSEICSRAISAELNSPPQSPAAITDCWIDTATLPTSTVIKPFGVPDEVMIHPRSLVNELSAWIKTIEAKIPVANQNYLPSELLDKEVLTKTLEPGSHWKLCLYTTKVISYVKHISIMDFSLGLWFIYGDKCQSEDNLKEEIPILKVRFLPDQTYEILELAGLRQISQDPKPAYSYDNESICFRISIPDSDEELVFTGYPKTANQFSGRVISTVNEEEQWLGLRKG